MELSGDSSCSNKGECYLTTIPKPFFYRTQSGLDPRLKRLVWGAGLALLLCLALPAFKTAIRQALPNAPAPLWFALFVALLGIAYMLVEIYLLQRLGLFLGYPALSLAVTLFALLFSSAAGSLLGGRLKALNHSTGIGLAAVITAAACSLFGFLQSFLLPAALYLDISWRVLLTAVSIMPLGGLMGLCFPASLRLLGAQAAQRIPWMWGLNGIASVLGSALAVVLAMHWGTVWVLVAGAGTYLLAGAVLLLGGISSAPPSTVSPAAPFSWRRALFFLAAVGLVWYGVFTFIAADYWRVRPPLTRPAPPSVDPAVWPQALNSEPQPQF